MGFWSKLKPSRPYKLDKLIDRRVLTPFDGHAGIHIICDIDKTYLETEFDSLLDIAKVAIQDAADKVTVVGSTPVLIAARWGTAEARVATAGSAAEAWKLAEPNHLHFVSSSPPQLRKVLEEKLAGDGLDWSSDSFKNQAYNLRRGRMDLLKHHVGYKSGALLDIARRCGAGSRFYLVGDNAESDTYIYIGFKLLVEGRLTADGYRRYLKIAGVDDTVAADLMTRAAQVQKSKIGGILIRNLKGYRSISAPPLTDAVTRFDTFLEAGAFFALSDVCRAEALPRMLRQMHNRFDLPRSDLSTLLQVLENYSAPESNLRKIVDGLKVTYGASPSRPLFNPLSARENALDGISEHEILTLAEKLHKDTEVMRALRKSRRGSM